MHLPSPSTTLLFLTRHMSRAVVPAGAALWCSLFVRRFPDRHMPPPSAVRCRLCRRSLPGGSLQNSEQSLACGCICNECSGCLISYTHAGFTYNLVSISTFSHGSAVWCMWMCTLVHIHMHTHAHARTHTHTHIHARTHTSHLHFFFVFRDVSRLLLE